MLHLLRYAEENGLQDIVQRYMDYPQVQGIVVSLNYNWHGFLIYATTSGTNEIGDAVARRKKSSDQLNGPDSKESKDEGLASDKIPKRKFFSSWFHE